MLSCDYNGWTDAPEDEREELDCYFSDVVRPDAEAGRRPGGNGFSAAAVLTHISGSAAGMKFGIDQSAP